MRKTIRNVTMVVPVLITSCHVSLKWKIGPVVAHSTMMATATTNAVGWPAVRAVHFAKRENFDVRYIIIVPPVCRRCFVQHKFAVPQTQSLPGLDQDHSREGISHRARREHRENSAASAVSV